MAKEISNIPSNIYPLRVQVVGASGEQVTDFGGSGGSITNYALETGGNLAAATTSLAILDDWDESDRAKTNIIVGQAGVQGASGTVTANTLRVVLATDIALPAGTNAIGKLSANSGIDIGDVDVTSLIPGTGATSLGKAVDSVAGSTDTGVAALFVRRDTPTTLTPADGDYARAGLDSLGSQWVREYWAPTSEDNSNGVIAVVRKAVVASTYSGTAFTSFGTATKANPKASAGVMISIEASNENAAVRYLQLHNKASNPAGTDVPIFSFPIPAGTANSPGIVIIERDFLNDYYFSTGVSWAVSTTKATFTDSATASEHTLNGLYV